MLFEQVAKEQIYRSINTARIDHFKNLKEFYLTLENRLGRQPELYDFVEHNSVDPVTLLENFKHYDQFLSKLTEQPVLYTEQEDGMLSFISQELLNGKRRHELLLLQILNSSDSITIEEFQSLVDSLGLVFNKKTILSAIEVLQLNFFTAAVRKKYAHTPLIQVNSSTVEMSLSLRRALGNDLFKKRYNDVIRTGLRKSEIYDSERELTLYEKYTRKDVARLLNWDQDESSTMYGYKLKHNTCPIFVTYHKSDEIDANIAYGDEFIDDAHFKWFTRSNRKISSNEIQKLLTGYQRGDEFHFFIKKDNDEGKDFYYLGKVDILMDSIKQEFMTDKVGQPTPVVTMTLKFEQPVEFNLYHYLTQA